MLVFAQLPGESTIILDSITNRHTQVKLIGITEGAARIGYDCSQSNLIFRQEVIDKTPFLTQIVGKQFSKAAQSFVGDFVGRIVSGTITGTSDITRRGLVVATLGNLDPDAETPIRLLILTEAKDWHVINNRPLMDVLAPTVTELFLQRMFTTSCTSEAVEEAFA